MEHEKKPWELDLSEIEKILEDYRSSQARITRLMMLCVEAENNFRTTVSVKEIERIMGWD
jgi:hypothetical protein